MPPQEKAKRSLRRSPPSQAGWFQNALIKVLVMSPTPFCIYGKQDWVVPLIELKCLSARHPSISRLLRFLDLYDSDLAVDLVGGNLILSPGFTPKHSSR